MCFGNRPFSFFPRETSTLDNWHHTLTKFVILLLVFDQNLTPNVPRPHFSGNLRWTKNMAPRLDKMQHFASRLDKTTGFDRHVPNLREGCFEMSLPELRTGSSRSTTVQRIYRKRIQLCRTDPGFPTPGGRMTVVYTNSLKQCDVRLVLSLIHI